MFLDQSVEFIDIQYILLVYKKRISQLVSTNIKDLQIVTDTYLDY